MASGRFGKADLAANADTDLYTVPAGTVATANVNLCNRNATAVTVRIAIRSGAIANSDYIEYAATIPGGGVLERTGLALAAGETITVQSSATNVSARAHGFEESV